MIDSNTLTQDYLNLLMNFSDSETEASIHTMFCQLICALVASLDTQFRCISKSEIRTVVGGFLASPLYDIRSQTDPAFLNSQTSQYIIATEIKTEKTLKDNSIWYKGSRGVQTLSALYAFVPLYI